MHAASSEDAEALRAENERLQAENRRLRALLSGAHAAPGLVAPPPGDDLPDLSIWFDSVSDAIFVADAGWNIQHWNSAAEQLYGWPRGDAVGQPISAVIAVVRYLEDYSDETATRILATVGDWRGTFVQRTRDGREVVVEGSTRALRDAQGAIVGYIGINRDVTARVRAEEALQAAQRAAAEALARIDALMRSVPMGVAAFDAELRYVLINPVLAELNGRPPADHLGRRFAEVLPWLAAQQEPLLRQVLATGEPVRDTKLRGIADAGDGRPHDWLLHVFPVRGSDGLTIGVGVTLTDITQRTRDEAALQAYADSLSQANAALTRALRLKDEFLAMMTHELRSPFISILGFAEGLDEGLYGPLSEAQHHAARQVAESGRHLLRLLSEILDLAAMEADDTHLKPEPIDLELCCAEALQAVKAAAAQKGIQTRLTMTWGISGLRADAARLRQVLVNLLDNAVKFTPAGGAVGLEVVADAAEEQVRLSVWDTGIGIDAAGYERLFVPFTQVDGRLARMYGGIGVGLAQVRRIVALHGGGVGVESAAGQGSRFTVSLPWQAGAPAEQPPAPVWDRPPRVVLADDHEPSLARAGGLLRQLGCPVTLARSGPEALAQLRAMRPDVAILDTGLLGAAGQEALGALRADPALAATALIALAGVVLPGDRERALAAGASAFLPKPAGRQALLDALGSAWPPPAPGR